MLPFVNGFVKDDVIRRPPPWQLLTALVVIRQNSRGGRIMIHGPR
jgi:hypothetical protein